MAEETCLEDPGVVDRTFLVLIGTIVPFFRGFFQTTIHEKGTLYQPGLLKKCALFSPTLSIRREMGSGV